MNDRHETDNFAHVIAERERDARYERRMAEEHRKCGDRILCFTLFMGFAILVWMVLEGIGVLVP